MTRVPLPVSAACAGRGGGGGGGSDVLEKSLVGCRRNFNFKEPS